MQTQDAMLGKVLIIGDSGVGKTSIATQLSMQRFERNYKQTVGVDFSLKPMFVKDTKVHLQLWDIAGHERSQSSMLKLYCRGANACVIVFDITNASSFESIDTWREMIIAQDSIEDIKTFPLLLIGNKIDREDERKVSYEDAQAWCQANGNIPYFEVSTKDNFMLEEAFQTVVEAIYERIKNPKRDPDNSKDNPSDSFILRDMPPPVKGKRSGCAC